MSSPARSPSPADTDRRTDFWTLLLADPDLLRAEFDALVADVWPDRPGRPPRRGIPGVPHPGGRERCPAAAGCRVPVGRRSAEDGRPRQRSPPGAVLGS
ncbi:hypothetical protein GCM10022204_24770 [Microlunatus aurantiacus]|uniref:DUF4240 domain-containing protein n=1 Tax=Microlunatus aurantiacus TaxID=446786 RepID=A0ABP7DNH6_9ACTN